MSQLELPQDLKQLDSNQPEVIEVTRKKFHDYFNSTKDSWLMNGLIDYYVATGCRRCVEIVVGVREPHDLHFFNKMAESLRNTSSSTRLSVLTLLSGVIMRQPTWLYKITNHGVFKEMLKILKTEADIVNIVSALLTLVVLLPMIPASFGASLHEIFDVFSRLAAWNTANPNKLQSDQLVHLQISLHFLFHRLYGMYPCNFLSYLRQQYGARENLPVFSHTIKPMLDTVKMHPLLVTTSKETETTTNRWKTMEHHDVVVECAKLALDGKDDWCPAAVTSLRNRSESEIRRLIEASGYQELKSAASQPGDLKDLWGGVWTECSVPVTPLPLEASAPTNIPLTPVTQVHIENSSFPHEIGTSPPEAAVEATPETTPVKDPRLISSRLSQPPNPAMARALNLSGTQRWNTTLTPTSSNPSSPMKKDHSPFRFPEREQLYGETVQRKIQNIVQDRSAASASEQNALNGVDGGHDGLQDEQEDQEVLQISQLGELSIDNLTSGRHCDSVLQDYHPAHTEDLEQCEQEGGSPCPAGGLHMPNSTSLLHFHRNHRRRLRYYSQCGTDLYYPTAILGGSEPLDDGNIISASTFVRRAYSCPEMKKERPSFTAIDTENQLDETLELETVTVTTGTQTKEEDLVPLYPYDHMLLTLLPPASVPTAAAAASTTEPLSCSSPSLLLDRYLDLAATQRTNEVASYGRRAITEAEKNIRDQLVLMHLQLKFERHRRDSHAERNRRLLGKSRNNRWLEEHNAALRDQLALLDAEIHNLHMEISKLKDERKKSERAMQVDIEKWKDQSLHFEKQNRELKSENQRLLLELQQNKLMYTSTTKRLQQVEAMFFSAGRELAEARALASAGETLRSQVAYLQKELVLMGEQVNRNRGHVSLLSMRSGKSKQLFYESYQEQVRILSSQLDARVTSYEAMRARVADLEVNLSRKDMHLVELKRTLKAAKEECREQLEAVETKYKSEVATNRKLECHVLELRSKLESAGRRTRRNVSAAQDALSLAERGGGGGINSPLSISLSSSEGLSLSSTLTTDAAPSRDLQAVLDAPESSTIPEIPEFDDLPGVSRMDDGF